MTKAAATAKHVKPRTTPGRGIVKAKIARPPGRSKVPVGSLRLLPLRARPAPPPRYFVEPEWGAPVPFAGATWMSVVIGPGQGGPGMYGSRPEPGTPTVMRRLLDDGRLNGFGWVAGHLLNDNLGGPGNARNLTPLTTAGNKNHLVACEQRIKNFINAAYSRSRNYPNDTYWFGVAYEVTVGDEKWDDGHPSLCHVAKAIYVTARVIKVDKQTGNMSNATRAQTGIRCFFGAIRNFAVDNTGHRLI